MSPARVIVRWVKRANGWVRIEIPNDTKTKTVITWSQDKPEKERE